MASVSIVSSSEFRATLSPQQNNATENEDPFSLLLNAVTDVNANVGAPEAPKGAERRNDVPAKQPKLDTNADRQAKRNASDAEKPETKAQSEACAPIKNTDAGDDTDEAEGDTDGDDTSAADALLMLALNETQQQTPASVQAATDASAAAQVAAAPVVVANVQVTAETQAAPALAAAIAEVTAATPVSAETQPAQTMQNAAQSKAQFEIVPATVQAEAEVESTLPKITAETISSLLKPVKTASHLDANAQVQTQPGSVNVASATALQGPAHLEMLNAAISKHVQLALGQDAGDQPQDTQKPLISSNAVAPNFALTAQVNAPVQVQTQQVVEAARAVPLENLAVEIATRAGKGERRFDIRLDPPELGRIDVRLEIDNKGNTTTKLIVERSETLDMLQRDARGLEKALQNAGLKLDAGGMQFSLQQDAQTQQGHQNHAPDMRGRPDLIEADAEIMTEISAGNASLAAQIRGGVDIRI